MQSANSEENTESLQETKQDVRNADPISGKAGAHPVGTGVGAALGGVATGALAGTVAGPVGAAVGAVVGGVAGAYGGKAAAESINPTSELAYWESNFMNQSYYEPNLPYSEYQTAYKIAIESYRENCSFEDRETDLRLRWENENPNRTLRWENTRQVMLDAWRRLANGNYDPNHRSY